MKYQALFVIFEKAEKFEIIIGGALIISIPVALSSVLFLSVNICKHITSEITEQTKLKLHKEIFRVGNLY